MYRAIANSNLYHCGCKWIVVDDSYKIVGRFPDQETADNEAARCNALTKLNDDIEKLTFYQNKVRALLEPQLELLAETMISAGRENWAYNDMQQLCEWAGLFDEWRKTQSREQEERLARRAAELFGVNIGA